MVQADEAVQTLSRPEVLAPASRSEYVTVTIRWLENSGRFHPRILFRWAKLHALFVCPVAKPGRDLWRTARDVRSFELGAFSGTTGRRPALSLLAGEGSPWTCQA
jgi:hypothetical protein